MTDKVIQVVALVVANDILTFYRTDGSVFTITQGDPRGGALSDEFFAQKRLGKEVVSLVIGKEDVTITHLNNPKRSPLIRFFRALKTDVEKLFGLDTKEYEDALTEKAHQAAAQKVREVAASLFDSSNQSCPNQSSDLPVRIIYSEEPLSKDETIIGVTSEGIVPGVENLSDQFQAGEEGKAPSEGPDNLIKRLAAMSAKRGHTARELMDFIQLIDLPILSDGAFFAYKRLLSLGKGVYVDPHTKLVHQRIGDIVQMDEALVDPSKRHACSQGLHIGSRHYMGSFWSGNKNSATMLVLVQPEDAIAVPRNESKARVCRYLIIADLSDKAQHLVNSNERMESCEETMGVVAQILAGARPAPLGIVNIGGNNGTDLTYTINGKKYPTKISLADATAYAGNQSVAPTQEVVPTRTIDDASQGSGANITPVKVRDKSFKVSPAAARAKVLAPAGTRKERACALWNSMMNSSNYLPNRKHAAQQLRDFKKTAKVSWDVLGLGKTNVEAELKKMLD